jgi:hypothetical protein
MKYYFEEDKLDLFQDEELDIIEKGFMIVYSIITIVGLYELFVLSYYNESHLFFYIILSHIGIYGFQKSFRNKFFYVFCLFMAGVHFIASFEVFGVLAISLKLTILYLILIQFIRYFSLKFQKSEISIPGKFSSYDFDTGKNATLWEYLLMLLYIVMIIGLPHIFE